MARRPLRILIVTPAPPRARNGNRVTALRWVAILRSLGHRVQIAQQIGDRRADLLIALHARKSADAVTQFTRTHPDCPVVVGFAGTDLYPEFVLDAPMRAVLENADRFVALQPLAIELLPDDVASRARVIFQSARPPEIRAEIDPDHFDACLIANLRDVKDPLLPARATRLLPGDSRLRLLHVGRALDDGVRREALAEAEGNPRYVWLGEQSRRDTLRILGGCRVMVVSSRGEGGSNVVSEALAADVPVLTTAIPGCLGIVGTDYPGTFPVGDEAALAELLLRFETDVAFRTDLVQRCADRAPLVGVSREQQSWALLLAEFLPEPNQS